MFRAGWLVVAVVAAFLAFPAASLAATYTVNTTADNAPSGSECSGVPGDCSLRQALDKSTSGDTVSVPANASDYHVTGTPISIPAGVSIVGGGASGTTVTGGGTNQIFVVAGGGSVSISAITLTDGNAGSGFGGALLVTSGDVTLDQVAITNSTVPGPTPRGGGAIGDRGGNLTITRSRFTNDTAASPDEGGAIYFGTIGGALSVSDTEFADNSANTGGAVYVDIGATGSFDRVTFDTNSASGAGGAMFFNGYSATALTVYNSTFSGNSAPDGGALFAFNVGASVTAVNDTFAGNSAPTGANVAVLEARFATQNSIFADPQGGGGNCATLFSNPQGMIIDDGNNLEDTSPSSCGFTNGANGDVVGESPQLASAPADNGSTVATVGGPPQTLALSSTSPALYAASASGCATVGSVDERSIPRPGEAGTACDIGAFELQLQTLTVTVNGSGTVTGGGISCPGTCSKAFPKGAQVSLSEQPDAGSSFSGWGGDCAGQAGCSVTMNTDQAVSATFTHAHHTLSVSVSGSGTVTGGGVSCPGMCSKSYAAGTSVTLQAKPASGYSFAGWSGDCTGEHSCSLAMSSDHSVKATFTRKRLRLAVSPASARAGTDTCLRFTVTSGGSAVGGALIRFAGKAATTSRHGHAQICATLPAGIHQARATKSPYRAAVFGVRITRPPSPPQVTFTG